jgi:Chitinase
VNVNNFNFQVVNDPSLRSRFVDNIVAFLKEHGFDGIDVDWEYPTQRGGISSDKVNYHFYFLKSKKI